MTEEEHPNRTILPDTSLFAELIHGSITIYYIIWLIDSDLNKISTS
jgi:hypothetical protein